MKESFLQIINNMQKIKIIGCGSMLVGDDAIGCVIARELQKQDLPEHVSVIEAGTPGLNLLNLMEPGERVIILDAVVSGDREEGTLVIFNEDQLPKPSHLPLSVHHIAIPEAIELGRRVQPELMPDFVEIWGVEVKMPVIRKMEMSVKVAAAIPVVLEKIKETLF